MFTEDVKDEPAVVLLTVHSNGTPVTPPVTLLALSSAAEGKKVCHPTISSSSSSEEWPYFLTCWHENVEATKLTSKDKVLQLLERCDKKLCKNLTWNAGGSLINKTVKEVMEAIEKLAIKEKNSWLPMFNYPEFRCTPLPPSWPLQIPCNQNMKLEEVFQFIEAKESGKRSDGCLLHTQGANATSSQYHTKQNELKNPKNTKTDKACICYGKQGHGHKAPSPYLSAHMHTANNRGKQILGAVILRF